MAVHLRRESPGRRPGRSPDSTRPPPFAGMTLVCAQKPKTTAQQWKRRKQNCCCVCGCVCVCSWYGCASLPLSLSLSLSLPLSCQQHQRRTALFLREGGEISVRGDVGIPHAGCENECDEVGSASLSPLGEEALKELHARLKVRRVFGIQLEHFWGGQRARAAMSRGKHVSHLRKAKLDTLQCE